MEDYKGYKGEDMTDKNNEEFPAGGVILDGGNADSYETGGWRKLKPVLDKEKCTSCLICWVMCPDSAIIVEDGKVVGFDMEHCKGCGICDVECPDKINAIKMVSEEEAD